MASLDFAFGDEDLYLDYYGCWIEVFRDEPEGIITSTEYLHETKGEVWFTLLQPNHVDQIIESLRKHMNELTIMSQTGVEKVIQFRNYCVTNPGY